MTDIPGRLPGRIACGGFSLVEVVISVGIVSFCLLALLGLLSVGLQNNRDSGNEMDAAAAASRFLQLRRSAPTNDLPLLPLGRADVSGAVTNYLTRDGAIVARAATGMEPDVAYRFTGVISNNPTSRSSTVRVVMEWPPARPSSSFELCTEILLP